MLWAVLADFRKWGGVHTIAAMDPRFEERVPGLNRRTLPADDVTSVPHESCQDFFHSLLKRCDAALIIAPETNGILAMLTEQVEKAGPALLGSQSSAVTIAGNKASCHKVFRKANLPTPETHAVRFGSVPRAAKKITYPVVVKPLDGIGCDGVCLVNHPSDLNAALDMIRPTTNIDRVVVQQFMPGTHASVSLLSNGDQCIPLSLNLQCIETDSQFKYLGSQIPLNHPAGMRGIELACAAVRAIPGLRGYIGVDLVLSGDNVCLIEVNPRLTTSYIGLRQVISVNVAEAIFDACVRGILPDEVSVSGHVVIKKDDPASWGYGEVNSGHHGGHQ